MRRTAITAAALALVLAAPAAALAAPVSWSYGYWSERGTADSMNTKTSAEAVANAAARVGYSGDRDLNGRPASKAWSEGRDSAVIGFFAHSNGAEMTTHDGADGRCCNRDDGVITAQTKHFPTPDSYPWRDYSLLDVEDVKLAILHGCDTADTTNARGSLRLEGERRGIDSMITFRGAPAFPSGEDISYGAYFWRRWGDYADDGATMRYSLNRALNDLIAKHGQAYDFDTWVVSGASPNPEGVRLTPAEYGDYNLLRHAGNLTASSTTAVAAPSDSYRTTDASGDLVSLSAPSTTSGEVRYSESEAVEIAASFLERQVSWFDEASFSFTDVRDVSHLGEDEELTSVTWRPTVAGVAGPAIASVEVDRRTGEVVFVSAHRAQPTTTRFSVREEQAVEAARTAVGSDGSVTSVEADVWDIPRWTVTIEDAGGDFRDITKVTVDARTGEVQSVARAN